VGREKDQKFDYFHRFACFGRGFADDIGFYFSIALKQI
jgi:hypothetical protein